MKLNTVQIDVEIGRHQYESNINNIPKSNFQKKSDFKIKFLNPILRLFYKYWAKYRLKITGRSNIEKLCTTECKQ